MDAADLARWTRFAAKGGIGKCTAVQDCIAESPEDLMFLKDDEITVLMHLPSGAGRYLGYCEGVVGRFQGAHVRFHGKLKRPVMTKRASSSAPGQSSNSGSPVPSPSPRIALVSLRDDSPQLVGPCSGTGGGARRHRTPERASSVLSDPFDLELELESSRRSGSVPRPSSGAGSSSPLNLGSRPGTAGATEANGTKETDSLPRRSEDIEGDCDTTRRKSPRVRAGDELPGLEMFYPGMRSRSSSRTRVGSALGTAGADSADPSSRPSSREQEDESAKVGRRRTRMIAVAQLQQLQAQIQSPNVSSLEPPPSPLLYSQTSQYSQSSQSSSPVQLAPPSPSSLTHPSLPPSPLPLFASRKSRLPQIGNEKPKPSPRSPGEDLQVQVSVDVVVKVSPSEEEPTVLSSESALAPEPSLVPLPSPIQSASKPPPVRHMLQLDVRNDDVEAAPGSPLEAEPTRVPSAERDRELEVSSLYDHGSVRSSIYSTRSDVSGSLSVSGLGFGNDTSEQRAESEDGALGLGIGLTMLQDMAEEEDDDEGAEEAGLRVNGLSRVMDKGESAEEPFTPKPPATPASAKLEEPSVYDESDKTLTEQQETTPSPLIDGGGRHKEVEEDMESEARGKENLRKDVSEDEDNENDDDDEYWDGGDIYDNYRYSRYSVMTRTSRRKSRFSVMSKYSVVSEALPPPIPVDARASPSPVPRFTSSPAPASPLEERKRHVPPPLTLVKSNSISPPALLSPTFAPNGATGRPPSSDTGLTTSGRTTADFGASPLLHTNFPSPQTSSSRVTSFGSNSGGSGSGAGYGQGMSSPLPRATTFTGTSSNSAAGAASALRQRLQNERGPSPPLPLLESVQTPVDEVTERPDSRHVDSMGRGSGIVVEDDEGVSVTIVSADAPEEERGNGNKLGNNQEHNQEHDAARESIESVASVASVASYATDASVASDVSKEMRRMEADLVSASTSSPVLAGMSASSKGPVLSSNEQHTPTSSVFSVGPTQPLRLGDRASQRAALSQEQTKPSQSMLLNTQQHPQAQPAVQQQRQQAPLLATHLRPQLQPGQGQGLFLPHPNAPRPNPSVLSGQRLSTYGMPPVHESKVTVSPSAPPGTSTGSLQATLRMAATPRVGPAGVPTRPTIFGKTVVELASADGPVAMVWSLQPFPIEPSSRAGTPVGGRMPKRAATAGSAPSPLSRSVELPSPSPIRTNSPAPVLMTPPASTQMSGNINKGSNVLARPNFLPQVGTSRPRSRSFSGFASDLPVNPALKERASEEGSRPSRTASLQSLKDAVSAPTRGSYTPPAGHSSRQVSVSSSPPGRGILAPSPLSDPRYTVLGSTHTPSSPKTNQSPLRYPPILSHQIPPTTSPDIPSGDAQASSSTQIQQPNGRAFGVRQVASVGILKLEHAGSPVASQPMPVPRLVRRSSGQTEGTLANVPAPNTAPFATEQVRRTSSSSSGRKHERTVSQQSRASSSSDMRSSTVSPQPLSGENSGVQRSNSAKSKLSLSRLRIRSSNTKDTRADTQTPSPSTGPATPVFEFDGQPETVQVQDAEFEMIRPAMRRVSTSDDTGFGRDERSSLQIQPDARAESPSVNSLRSSRSPIPGARAELLVDAPQTLKPVETESVASVEAHRARELRWIAAMASVPAAQSRKSKKIRRLVLEGVPASVRYLVWAHLTESKSRHTPGVYGVLGRRGRVAATEAIERDAAQCFPDQPHLQDPRGPLVSMLQTYLKMVPDIEYQTNLVLIAGHLLLQSPEEDAFWTFVSMMDLHLRAYFSSRSVQMEADATVFGKAVESMHPQLAKKLFIDMGINPLEICRTWFSSLFISSLPLDYVNRIWDMYLCEGPPFLFRVGLALLSFSRSSLEAARDRTSAISLLSQPNSLPTDPDALITAALAVRLRDDDVRKQRVKLEAQLKRQTQTAQRAGSAPRLMSSISLPRTGV